MRTNGELLRNAIAFALMKLNVRARKSTTIKLSEEDRFAVADNAIKNMRGYADNWKWLDAPASEPKVGETGPSMWKPPE